MARKTLTTILDEFVKLVGYSRDGAEILNRRCAILILETVAESMNARMISSTARTTPSIIGDEAF